MLLNKLMFCMVLYCSSLAQSTVGYNKPPLVQTEWTNDWSHKIFLFPENYWDAKEAELVAAIGRREFEKVKQMSHRDYMPCAMQLFCEDKDGSPKKNTDTLNKKYGRLKMYKIATFHHTSSSGSRSGPYAILRVPYQENKTWDATATWDTVYFVIPDKYIRTITPGFVQKTAPAENKFSPVKIKNWNNVIFTIQDSYWSKNDMEDQVSRQVGAMNASVINVYFRRNKIPAPMLRESYKGIDDYSKEMNKLKIYKVVSFEGVNASGAKEKYCVIRIPFDQDWNPTAKWDLTKQDRTLCIVPEKDIEVLDGQSLRSF